MIVQDKLLSIPTPKTSVLLLQQFSHFQYKVKKISFGIFVLWLWSCIWFSTSLETYDQFSQLKKIIYAFL